MPSPDIQVTVDSRELQQDLKRMPRLMNQAMNREFRLVGGEFGRVFARAQLRRGGVEIRRGGVPKGNAPGDPALPKKMRLAGFKGQVRGRQSLEAKALSIRTRNPAMVAHELGATITAPGGWLRLRFRRQPQGVSPEERRKAFIVKLPSGLPLIATRTGAGKESKLVALGFLKPRVTIKPRLGFIDTWDAFLPRALSRLDAATAATLKRLTASAAPTPASAGGSE